MKYAKYIGASVVTLLMGGSALVLTSEDIGPAPVCNGERATHVLIGQDSSRLVDTDGDPDTPKERRFFVQLADDRIGPFLTRELAVAAAQDRYLPWLEEGVQVVVEPDAGLVGTDGHDVLVSLISTEDGGFIGKTFVKSQKKPATAGDFMCSFLEESDDLYYAASRADYIEDHGGADDYYLGGCALEGEGVPGDRECDVLIDSGPVGPFGKPQFSEPDGRDRVWGLTVPKGRIQRITTGDSFGHHYVGKGPGKVIIDGGACFARKEGELVPCAGHEGHPGVGGSGDHVHPCPEGSSDPKFLGGLEGGFKKNGITVFNVEYFGPEKLFAGPDALDPCAYESESL